MSGNHSSPLPLSVCLWSHALYGALLCECRAASLNVAAAIANTKTAKALAERKAEEEAASRITTYVDFNKT